MCCLLVEQPCWQFTQRSKFESHRDSCWWKWSYDLRQLTRMLKFQPCRVNWGWKYFYRIGSGSFHPRSVDRNSKFEFEFESHIEQKLLLIVIQPSFLSESLPGGDSGQVFKNSTLTIPDFFSLPEFPIPNFFFRRRKRTLMPWNESDQKNSGIGCSAKNLRAKNWSWNGLTFIWVNPLQ